MQDEAGEEVLRAMFIVPVQSSRSALTRSIVRLQLNTDHTRLQNAVWLRHGKEKFVVLVEHQDFAQKQPAVSSLKMVLSDLYSRQV